MFSYDTDDCSTWQVERNPADHGRVVPFGRRQHRRCGAERPSADAALVDVFSTCQAIALATTMSAASVRMTA